MIFDKDYDRALWMMLKADRKNRRMIAGFIKSIPERMLSDIQEKLLIFEEYQKKQVSFCDRDEKHLYGQCETSDQVLYWFSIDSVTGTLNLGYQVFDGVRYVDVFELSLMPNKEMFKLSTLEDVTVGSIEYDITEEVRNGESYIVNSYENKYNLMKTSLGHVVFYSNDKAAIVKFGVKKINLKKIPEEIFVTDFNTSNRGMARVRKPL